MADDIPPATGDEASCGIRPPGQTYPPAAPPSFGDQQAVQSAPRSTPGAAPFSALHDALAQLPCTDAARANGALLQTFQEVLDTLIGVPLTARLLQPIWDIHIVQDTTS